MSRRKSGQALVEIAPMLGAILLLFAAGASLLGAQWNRTRCLHLAFGQARQSLTGDQLGGGILPRPLQGLWGPLKTTFQVHRDTLSVTVTAHCGRAEETVRLPRLENGRW